MANTLKFGNGQWATKEGSTLAYNDENGNFKPLPFNFDRSTSATRVNKQGLIEVVSNNEPRIDFTNDSKGALKLEPSRTNLVQYSEAFDNAYWTKSGSSVVNGFVSPSGDTNAFKLTEDTSNGEHKITRLVLTTNQRSEASFFVKSNGRNKVVLSMGTTTFQSTFDLSNGTFFNDGDSLGSIESLKNDWYKISINSSYLSPTDIYVTIKLLNNSNNVSYIGDGTSGVYIYGAQLEQGSYATSYIPTQGSVATRDAEKCEQNLSNVVSLTEGVVYIDTINLDNDGTNSNIISQNSVVDTVYCFKVVSNNKIACGLFASSVNIPIESTSAYPLGTRTKIAFHYKSGNSKLYINGSLEGTNNDSFTLGSGFATALRLIDTSSAYNAFPQKSTLNEFKIYNTALTDQELINLTKI